MPYGPPIETVRNMTIINKAIVNLTDSNSINSSGLMNELKLENEVDINNETSCIRKLEAISQVNLYF